MFYLLTTLQAFEITCLGPVGYQVSASVFPAKALNQEGTNYLGPGRWSTVTLWINQTPVIKTSSDRVDLQPGHRVIYLIHPSCSSAYKFVQCIQVFG